MHLRFTFCFSSYSTPHKKPLLFQMHGRTFENKLLRLLACCSYFEDQLCPGGVVMPGAIEVATTSFGDQHSTATFPPLSVSGSDRNPIIGRRAASARWRPEANAVYSVFLFLCLALEGVAGLPRDALNSPPNTAPSPLLYLPPAGTSSYKYDDEQAAHPRNTIPCVQLFLVVAVACEYFPHSLSLCFRLFLLRVGENPLV